VTVALLPGLTVSRETEVRLRAFAADILRWTARINLIALATPEIVWDRHIRDSAQVLLPITADRRLIWADLGSGAGLPGMVAAIILAETRPDDRMHLVESDGRKAAFLQQAAVTHAPTARVHAARIEQVPPLMADVVTARALAPLDRLLPLVARHLASGGTAILPKGRRAMDELAQARRFWQFDLAIQPGLVEPESQVLVLTNLKGVVR
jgi:16S rRNA (guanine527-N7)-methyltransferase